MFPYKLSGKLNIPCSRYKYNIIYLKFCWIFRTLNLILNQAFISNYLLKMMIHKDPEYFLYAILAEISRRDRDNDHKTKVLNIFWVFFMFC